MNLLCHGHSLSGLTRENRAGRFQEPARRSSAALALIGCRTTLYFRRSRSCDQVEARSAEPSETVALGGLVQNLRVRPPRNANFHFLSR